VKEATKIEIANFPTIAQLSAWKSYLKLALVEASGRRDEKPVVEWVQAVEAEGTKPIDFAESGVGFETLDRKLSAALMRVTKGELGRKINIESQLMNAKGAVLKGRQIYWMILNSFRTNPNMGMVYGVRDLSRVRWLGDDRLEAFQSNWFTVINQLRTPMTDGQLAEVLLELLDQSKEMKEDIAAYRRMIAQDLTKSYDYQYLLDTIDRHIAFKTQRVNAENLSRAIENAGKSHSLAAPKGRLPPCRFYQAGKCKAGGTCPYPHVNGGGTAKARSQTPRDRKGTTRGGPAAPPKGKGVKAPPPAKSKAETPCFKFHLGICPHTKADCHYVHRKLSDDEKVAFERFKKKQATAKAKPSMPSPKAPCPDWKNERSCVAGDSCPLDHAPAQPRPRGRSKSRPRSKSKA
jgi:hypothetical protein